MWGLQVFNTIAGIAGDWLQGMRDRMNARNEAAIAITRARVDHEITWDTQQARNAETSWKDEFWTIILAIPLVLCFIPGMVPFVREGFEVMRDVVPDWYIAAVSVAIAAAFGWNRTVRLMNRTSGRPMLVTATEELQDEADTTERGRRSS